MGRRGLARLQGVLDATVWPRLGGGCHLGRDTHVAIERAGFLIESVERFDFKPSPISAIANPHLLGVARNAGNGEAQR